MGAVPRLRRSDCAGPGIVRRRRGRGFEYRDPAGAPVTDPEALTRIADLAIPPAWHDVWICPDALGHLQATGVDAAGRKQYLYHERWRRRRDQQKFDSMLEFARALPALRRRVRRDLGGDELSRGRVLACATRLLDLGFFRMGSEDYAERNESYGLATMLKRHASVEDGEVVFDYPAKSGRRRIQAIADPDVGEIVKALRRRRGGGPELLAYRDDRGRWRDLRSDDINDYVKELTGQEFTAKDFRTWNATVLAALALAQEADPPTSEAARRRAIAAAVKQVAVYLGNTPAVCRASYIDPRVFDRYRSGWTIRGAVQRPGGADLARPRARERIESAVLDLLEERETPALEQVAA
ncbi:MAG: DNA topoisomerase IB [Solirubrobacteraceae bacterium]